MGKENTLRHRSLALVVPLAGLMILITGPTVSTGAILFVDASAQGANNGTSWANAYTDLQAALSHARTTGEVEAIWVADGTYKPAAPGGDRSISFDLVNGVALFGGFAGGENSPRLRRPLVNRAILSGDLNGDDDEEPGPSTCCFSHGSPSCDITECAEAVCAADPFCCKDSWDRRCVQRTLCLCGSLCSSQCDNSYHVVRALGANQQTVLNGFFVVGGNANGDVIATSRGGGMVVDGGSPTVANCLFFDNHAETATGPGGIGGGLFSNAAVQVVNTTFVGNTARLGGAVFNGAGMAAFTNCVFSGNNATEGGAMQNVGSSPVVTNVTFSLNTARTGGGMANSSGSRPRITNSIFWGNNDSHGNGEFSQISVDISSVPIVNYCNVEGLFGSFGGVGNISADPRFVADAGADFLVGTPDDDLRLSEGSPCIDAGSNQAAPSDIADLDGDGDRAERLPLDREGKARFFDDPRRPNTGQGAPPLIDIGAFELGSDCNENGILDDEDVATHFSEDCNDNSIPDECEIRRDSSAPGGPFYCSLDCNRDCDNNGIPDNCQPDADRDGVINVCDRCPGTPIDVPVDDDGCSLPGACCFAVGACFDAVADVSCRAIKGRFLGYGLTCDTDTDHDGALGCDDGCPADPFKSAPGVCGCGVPDDDTDGDGLADCVDRCPTDDPDDSDGDGLCDSEDPCPLDTSGDTDGDGVCDSEDPCPRDNPDDRDGDGICTSMDLCPDDPEKGVPGLCGCGVPDDDTDADGVVDCLDECAETPPGIPVDDEGCPAVGACCFRVGVCVDDAGAKDCRSVGGRYQGHRTDCDGGCASSGDMDRDGDLDLEDFAAFLDCVRGPAVNSQIRCDLADFDGDERIDLIDIAAFQNGFTGAQR